MRETSEGGHCPYLIVVDAGRQNSVQDSFLDLSVIEDLQRVKVSAAPTDNEAKDH